jgi:large repetitive protein
VTFPLNPALNDPYITPGGTRYKCVKVAPDPSWQIDGSAASPVTPLPPWNIFSAVDQADMLALSANVRDLAVRADDGVTYGLVALPATTLANWVPLAVSNSGGALSDVNSTFHGLMTPAQLAQLNYLLANAGNAFVAVPSAGALPGANANALYTTTISVTGGTTPYAYTLESGSLPAGVALNPNTGALAGIANAAGAYAFAVRATDDFGAYKIFNYTMAVTAVTFVFSPLSLPNPQPTVAYNQTIAVSGGSAPYTFAVSAGALPAGLLLNPASGIVSGMPAGPLGAYSYTITVTDGNGNADTHVYSGTVTAPLVMLTATVSNGAVSSVYTDEINATGGTAHTFAVTAGSLPPGVILNAATGVLSGTPTLLGTFTFTITATSFEGYVGNQAYTVIVLATAPTIVVTPASATTGVISTQIFNQTCAASGGTAPYTFSLSGGTLPPGTTLNAATGVISGATTASGTYTFTIRATDAGGFSGTTAYSAVIASVPTITLQTLLGGRRTIAYSQSVGPAAGGTAPYTYAVTAGSLPPGLTLNPATGGLAGTPTLSGTYPFTITATDANGFTGAQIYSLAIAIRVTSSTTTTAGLAGVISTGKATWTAVAAGVARADRYLTVAVGIQSTNAAAPSSVTIGGVTATLVKWQGSGNMGCGLYTALVPAGATATVVVNKTGMVAAAMRMYEMFDLTSVAADSTGGNTVPNAANSATITRAAYGTTIGVGVVSGSGTVTSTWAAPMIANGIKVVLVGAGAIVLTTGSQDQTVGGAQLISETLGISTAVSEAFAVATWS